MKRLSLVVFLMLVLVMPAAAQLPSNPAVVDPALFEEIGTPGGELVLGLSTSPRSFNFYGIIDNAAYTILYNILDPLVAENPATGEIIPALAERWEVDESGTEVTFYLRDVKWSDGTPFTADDVVFTMKHVVMNPNAEGNSVDRFTLGGKPVQWEKIDDMTVKAILPSPYGAFTRSLSHALMVPKHKYEPFIAALNEGVEPGTINQAWTTDTPVKDIVGTGTFVLSEYIVDQKVTLTKNPYSWRVDPAGNQLPYVDRLVYLVVQDPEVMLAQFRSGEIHRVTITGQNYPALKREELAGANYRVLTGSPVSPTPSPPHLAFNWDVADEELREIFRNDKFRQAMEYTIDRYRIIEDVYNTLAIIPGVPVLPANTAFYNPAIEDIMRHYDIEKAKQLLDEVGITDRNGDGIRELPSGRPFELTLTTAVNVQAHNDIAVILKNEWDELGIPTHLQLISSALVGERRTAGEFEAIIEAFGNQPDPQLRKAIWQPGRALYYWHRSTMDDKQEPVLAAMEDWELRVFELFELGEVEMDAAQRKAYYDEWQAIYAEKVPVIYIAKGMELTAVSNNVGNVFLKDNGQIVGTNYTIFIK
ncbi:MAG: ABC transporter substrate-binding protein [Firmicutes bacterium]|nr:ABC transporter substrate-binding protein [Bacillota bacterium]